MTLVILMFLIITRNGSSKNILNFGQFLHKFDLDVQQLIHKLEEFNKKLDRLCRLIQNLFE